MREDWCFHGQLPQSNVKVFVWHTKVVRGTYTRCPQGTQDNVYFQILQ